MTNICVTGDTVIDVKFGNGEIDKVQISQIGALLELTPSIKVLSKNIESGEMEWKLITDFGMTDEFAEVYEIEDVNTGKTVKCTGNHKFLTLRGWIEAKDLVESDELVIN
jgi:intein/homing endonuclease